MKSYSKLNYVWLFLIPNQFCQQFYFTSQDKSFLCIQLQNEVLLASLNEFRRVQCCFSVFQPTSTECRPTKDKTASWKIKCVHLFRVLGIAIWEMQSLLKSKACSRKTKEARAFKEEKGNLLKLFWTKCDWCWHL